MNKFNRNINRNINNIIKQYLLPSLTNFKINKNKCLNDLRIRTICINYSLNKNHDLSNMIIRCHKYVNGIVWVIHKLN